MDGRLPSALVANWSRFLVGKVLWIIEFADVITKGAWELARQLGGVAVDDLGGLARVVEAHSGWIELLDQGFEGGIAVGEQGTIDVFEGAILGGRRVHNGVVFVGRNTDVSFDELLMWAREWWEGWRGAAAKEVREVHIEGAAEWLVKASFGRGGE